MQIHDLRENQQCEMLELMCNHEPGERDDYYIYLSGLQKCAKIHTAHSLLSRFSTAYMWPGVLTGQMHWVVFTTWIVAPNSTEHCRYWTSSPPLFRWFRFGRPIMRSLIVDAMHPQRPLKLHTACVALPWSRTTRLRLLWRRGGGLGSLVIHEKGRGVRKRERRVGGTRENT